MVARNGSESGERTRALVAGCRTPGMLSKHSGHGYEKRVYCVLNSWARCQCPLHACSRDCRRDALYPSICISRSGSYGGFSSSSDALTPDARDVSSKRGRTRYCMVMALSQTARRRAMVMEEGGVLRQKGVELEHTRLPPLSSFPHARTGYIEEIPKPPNETPVLSHRVQCRLMIIHESRKSSCKTFPLCNLHPTWICPDFTPTPSPQEARLSPQDPHTHALHESNTGQPQSPSTQQIARSPS